jgi:hypothetical protein
MCCTLVFKVGTLSKAEKMTVGAGIISAVDCTMGEEMWLVTC